MHQRAFSLVEVIVASGILGLTIPLVLNLLPTGFVSLRKAETLQVATSLALYRMDEVPFLDPQTGGLRETLSVGARSYVLTREFYKIDETRWDALVTCESENLTPIRLATRVIRQTH